MTNTEGSRINYRKPARASVAGSPGTVLQAGETIWLTGPRAGRLVRHTVTAVDGPKISYRKAGR